MLICSVSSELTLMAKQNRILPLGTPQVSPRNQEKAEGALMIQHTDDDDDKFYVIPPDFEKARKYAISKRVGIMHMEDGELDPFSGLPAKNELYPLCIPQRRLGELGSGFALFFGFLFFCMFLLLLLGGIVGGWNVYYNYHGNGCHARETPKYECLDNIYMKATWLNKDLDANYDMFGFLNIAFVGAGIVSVLFFRKWLLQTARKIDLNIVSVADYTIMVRGIPKNETKDEIFKFFNKPAEGITVNKVVMAYHIGEFTDLMEEKAKLELKRARKPNDQALIFRISHIDKRLNYLEDAINEFNGAKLKFARVAFVSFNYEKQAAKTRMKWDIGDFEKFYYRIVGCCGVKPEKTYKGKVISIERAPEPDEIFWENLGYKDCDLFLRRSGINLAFLILIGGSFASIIALKQVEETTSFKYFTLISSFIVIIINNLLGIFTRVFADYEKHTTWTAFYTSVAKSLSTAQFLNTGLVTWLVHYLIKQTLDHMWTKESMIESLYELFIMNALVPQILLLVDVSYRLKKYKQRREEKKGKNCTLTQGQANELFEGPNFDIAQIYANVMKTMLFTAFYGTLIPIGAVFSFFSVFFLYWVIKYLLLRRYARPLPINQDLCEEMTDYLELFFVCFAAGNIFFEYKIRNTISIWSFICMGIAGGSYCVPWKPFSRSFFGDANSPNQKNYDEARLNFYSEYDRANPLTQEDAQREFEEFLEKKFQQDKPESKAEIESARSIVKSQILKGKKPQGFIQFQVNKTENENGKKTLNTIPIKGPQMKKGMQNNIKKGQAIARQAVARNGKVNVSSKVAPVVTNQQSRKIPVVSKKPTATPNISHGITSHPNSSSKDHLTKSINQILPLFSKDNLDDDYNRSNSIERKEVPQNTTGNHSKSKKPEILGRDKGIVQIDIRPLRSPADLDDIKLGEMPDSVPHKNQEKLENEPLIDLQKNFDIDMRPNKVKFNMYNNRKENAENGEFQRSESQLKTKYY